MTSNLIERLINKEYLTERERKEWLNAIKERLEALEKENKELLEIRNIQACSINCLNTELEELYNDYEALDNELHITRNSVDSFVKENEKLKKENEQIKQWIVDKIKYLDKGVFLMSYERVKGAIEILNELLKEVINNEI